MTYFFSDNLNEMLGDLFLPCEAPEAPKQGFFKNLFGGGQSTLDREELCMYQSLGIKFRQIIDRFSLTKVRTSLKPKIVVHFD